MNKFLLPLAFVVFFLGCAENDDPILTSFVADLSSESDDVSSSSSEMDNFSSSSIEVSELSSSSVYPKTPSSSSKEEKISSGLDSLAYPVLADKNCYVHYGFRGLPPQGDYEDPECVFDELLKGRIASLMEKDFSEEDAKAKALRDLYKDLGLDTLKLDSLHSKSIGYVFSAVIPAGVEGDASRAKFAEWFAENDSIDEMQKCQIFQKANYENMSRFVTSVVPIGGAAYEYEVDEPLDMFLQLWSQCGHLPKCDEKRQNAVGEFKCGKGVACKDAGAYFACHEKGWEPASTVEIETKDAVCDSNYKTALSPKNSSHYYVCYDGAWHEFYETPCDSNNQRIRAPSSPYQPDIVSPKIAFDFYVCYNTKWYRSSAWTYDLPYEYYFNQDFDYGFFEDPRNGHVYRTTEYQGQTWLAENMKYYIKDDSLPDNARYCRKDSCKVTGNYYTYATALQACPDGWRLPKSSDFEKFNFEMNESGVVGGFDYFSQIGGSGGGYRSTTDKYGLSFLVVGPRTGYEAVFWLGDPYEGDKPPAYRITAYNAKMESYSPKDQLSVRCVKE